MVGDVAAPRSARPRGTPGAVALEVARPRRLRRRDGRLRVADLDLDVRQGEIVGLFGLLGAGCIEAALAVYGAWPGRREGAIRIDGAAVAIGGPDDAVALGLGLMAQDRRDCLIGGAVDRRQHRPRQPRPDRAGTAPRRRGRPAPGAGPGRRRCSIKAPSIDAEVRTLSGGNQQKVQVARWLAAERAILILIDPTRGVDVGARREIKRIWSELGATRHAPSCSPRPTPRSWSTSATGSW